MARVRRRTLALTRSTVPATAVPVAALLGPLTRNDDLVADADPDLVVATGAAVDLVCFVGLHVPYVDAVVGFRPAVRTHTTVTVSPPVDRPAHRTRRER